MKKCRRPLEGGKSKETDSLLGPAEGMQSSGPVLDSDFENWEIINMCCFKATKLTVIFL